MNKTFIGGYNNITVWDATISIPGGISVNQTTNGSGVPYVTYAAMGPAPVNSSGPSGSIRMDFLLAGGDGLGFYGRVVNPTTGAPWEDCEDNALSGSWKCRGYGAARCWIFPSVKSFNSSVRVGQLEETVLSADNYWGSSDGILTNTVDTHCIDNDERDALKGLGYNITEDERWIPCQHRRQRAAWSTAQ